jgi:hypothetical protein
MKKIIIPILALLLLSLSMSFVSASQVETTQVSAGTSQTLTFNLSSQDRFSGSLSISGGSGNDIDFKVTDPQGTVIVGLGRVSQGRSFDFVAQQSGAYTFYLDNSFSIFSSKTVSLSYDVVSPTPSPFLFGGNGDSAGSPLGYLFIIALIAVVIAIVVIVAVVVAVHVSRKQKAAPSHLPPPPPPT